MNNKEFLFGLSESIGTTEEIAGRLIKYINKCLGESFEKGSGIAVPSLGFFFVESRKEKVVVSPATHKRMLMPPQNLLRFSQERPLENVEIAEVQDLSANLAKKTRLPEDIATLIVKTFFGYIHKALQTDDTLTVDGLGSFQTTDEGETVVFTPSSKMEEIVNRPFSQFVPVVVNEGVRFPDIEGNEDVPGEHDDGPLAKKNDEDTLTDDVNSEKPQVEDKEENTEVENTDKNIDDKGTEIDKEKMSPITPDNEKEEPLPANPQKKRSFVKIAAITLASALILFGLGYAIGHSPKNDEAEDVKSDTLQKVERSHVNKNGQNTPKEDHLDYDKMNEQVKYGAYNIIGVDTFIVSAKSQPVRDIAAIYYGSELMEMYISALNDGKTMVDKGDTLKIPKLEVKKKK